MGRGCDPVGDTRTPGQSRIFGFTMFYMQNLLPKLQRLTRMRFILQDITSDLAGQAQISTAESWGARATATHGIEPGAFRDVAWPEMHTGYAGPLVLFDFQTFGVVTPPAKAVDAVELSGIAFVYFILFYILFSHAFFIYRSRIWVIQIVFSFVTTGPVLEDDRDDWLFSFGMVVGGWPLFSNECGRKKSARLSETIPSSMTLRLYS